MVTAGTVSAIVIALDEIRHPQPMAIMNVVWPVTALFGTIITVIAYLAYGRASGHGAGRQPFPISVGIAAAHCGSGCVIGDLIAEWLAYRMPAVAVLFGWQSL